MTRCPECQAQHKRVMIAARKAVENGGTVPVPDGTEYTSFQKTIHRMARMMNVEIATRVVDRENPHFIRVKRWDE